MRIKGRLSYDKLSLDDKKNIINKYYNTSYNFNELADIFSYSKRAISKVLKEANINTKRINRYCLNENYFKLIDSEQKAYILGLIYADGYVGNKDYNNIVLGLKDKEIIYEIASIIEYTGPIRKSKKGGYENSKESYVLNFSSKIMAEDLRKIGLYPNKSLSIAELPSLRDDLIRHFIRGYFDGDGSIILSKHTSYHIVNGNMKKYIYPSYSFGLLETEMFLKNIALITNFNHVKIINTRTEKIKELRVCAKCEFLNIFNYLYEGSTICLNRKYNKWLEIMSAFAM